VRRKRSGFGGEFKLKGGWTTAFHSTEKERMRGKVENLVKRGSRELWRQSRAQATRRGDGERVLPRQRWRRGRKKQRGRKRDEKRRPQCAQNPVVSHAHNEDLKLKKRLKRGERGGLIRRTV